MHNIQLGPVQFFFDPDLIPHFPPEEGGLQVTLIAENGEVKAQDDLYLPFTLIRQSPLPSHNFFITACQQRLAQLNSVLPGARQVRARIVVCRPEPEAPPSPHTPAFSRVVRES